MPLPIILGIAAAVAAAGGVGSGIHGGVKMKRAGNTMKEAQKMQNEAVALFKDKSEKASASMDKVGQTELEILVSFGRFVECMERIQNKPVFEEHSQDSVELPQYEPEQLKKVSTGAGMIIGGLSGAAAGTAGGFAAAGATTAAVMALGSASTGAAIAGLSGAAATNATLAALGGGAIAAGGGGIALGTTILGASTFGVALLVGGVIFSITGSKLSDKADEAYVLAQKTKKEVDQIVLYLDRLCYHANRFRASLKRTRDSFAAHLADLDRITSHKADWGDYSSDEKRCVKNTILLVGMLYKMCQLKLVLKDESGSNQVNAAGIKDFISESKNLLEQVESN